MRTLLSTVVSVATSLFYANALRLPVPGGRLIQHPSSIARQESGNRSGIHLAVSPVCGPLSGKTADANSGIDLKQIKTIVAFGVSHVRLG